MKIFFVGGVVTAHCGRHLLCLQEKTKQNQLGKQPFQLGQDSVILRVHEYISASVDSSSIVAMCDAQFVYLLTKVMKE